MQLLWFKRDLRLVDHPALVRAVKARASNPSKHGEVLPVYIFEPELWRQPDMSHRHYVFLYECLTDLYRSLKAIGCPLVVKVGDAVEVLEALHQKYEVTALWSHQETWNGWTFERDKRVASWAKDRQIVWYEPLQYGVFRRIDRMQGRDHWSKLWYEKMNANVLPAPLSLTMIDEPSDVLPTPEVLGLVASKVNDMADKNHAYDKNSDEFVPNKFAINEFRINDDCRQLGGREHGLATLQSFLAYRGERYTKQMSSPVTAFDSCSRLSPYLAFGVLSMREVFVAYKAKNEEVKNRPKQDRGAWGSAMRSFSARLRWHCHFIQKLESEPEMEFYNLHPVYDGLREHEFHEAYFKAWQTGHTGYPMIDACMRALIVTGWINFRMRAMLMSFASYHLWLHWRRPALHLARLFVDYEPGIHYSQAQMQSGTTGINSIRVYNPIKQGVDQDPEGVFIKRWIPELANMPTEFIHTPWLCADDLTLGIEVMNGYPMPIVDEKTARRQATDKLSATRKHHVHGDIAKKIVEKHGSRKVSRKKRKSKQADGKVTNKNGDSSQIDLF